MLQFVQKDMTKLQFIQKEIFGKEKGRVDNIIEIKQNKAIYVG